MAEKQTPQRMTHLKFSALDTWINAYLRDVKTRGLSAFTYQYYRRELDFFLTFCADRSVIEVTQVDPALIREYLEWLEKVRKRNPGGRHAGYRAVRAFLTWWAAETEPDDWTNPTKKAKAPRVILEPIEPVTLQDVKAMLEKCGDDFTGHRDRAIILCLLDTGARAREFLALALADVDHISGAVIIRKGKGGKSRTVFIGKKSRRALRSYLKRRSDTCPALWVTIYGEPLAVSSLQGILSRRAKLAGIAAPSPHDFRRAFALNMLRAGVNIYALKELMGHSDLSTLLRYLAITQDDTKAAHDKGSPVDKLL
ncbi:MAG TPA: tyrosine-type recombinase/integrase [Anaerolineales bacterium]|jgi:site-specific recombinase XerD